MSLTDLEIIYKTKCFWKSKYKNKVANAIFHDLFHDAIETYIKKSKEAPILFPKSYFGWLLKSKVSNFRANRKAKNTDYVEKYPEIPVEMNNFISFGNVEKDLINAIMELPTQQKLMAKEYLINENAICEIAEKHNINYMTTKANVRHMLRTLKTKLKHLQSQNDTY